MPVSLCRTKLPICYLLTVTLQRIRNVLRTFVYMCIVYCTCYCGVDAPVVTCPTTKAHPGQRSVRLRCEIRARPDLSALFWIIDVNGTTVAEGTTIDNFWSASMVSQSEMIMSPVRYYVVILPINTLISAATVGAHGVS